MWWLASAEIAKHDYWFFLREILQYRWMDPWFHGEVICNFLTEHEEESVLILIPRGHGKTGMITVPRLPWRLAKNPLGTNLILNAREDKAAKFAKAAAAIITNNYRYKLAFPDVIPSAKWGEAGYYLDLEALSEGKGSLERTDPSLMSLGVLGNITGSHYSSEMIMDDIINSETIKEVNHSHKIKMFFGEALNCLDANKPLTVVGTRWFEDDIYGLLESGELEGNHGRIKVLKLGATDKAGNLVWPERVYFDIRGNEHSSGWTHAKLETQRKNLGGLFSALYYNEPSPDEDVTLRYDLVDLFDAVPFKTSGVSCIGIEAESQGLSFLSYFRRFAKEERINTVIEQLESKKVKKEERIIANLQDDLSNGLVKCQRAMFHATVGLAHQMRKFPKGHDDMLDVVSYLRTVVRPYAAGQSPKVAITCDPSFSSNYQSDYTAIAVGCHYDGYFWILEGYSFKTSDISSIAKILLRLYNKYGGSTNSKTTGGGRFDVKITGFNAPNEPEISRDSIQRDSMQFEAYDPTRELLEKILKK